MKKAKTDQLFEQVADPREKPQIPLEHILTSMMSMPMLGTKSLLQLDQQARTDAVRAYIGTSRKQVCSDTTCERLLKKISSDDLRACLIAGTRKDQEKICLAIVDGSGYGDQLASVVILAGKTEQCLDLQVYQTKGKELCASRRALERITNNAGKGWCDVLVADGLYMTKEEFRLAKERYGCDLLVKTQETTLCVIEDAQALIARMPDQGIECLEGTDIARGVTYQARAVSDIEWEGLDYRLKVALVTETKIKGEQSIQTFSVITTRQDLTASQMRELAHQRWRIENNVFRQMNALCASKQVHTHKSTVLTNLLLLWHWGLNLLKLFCRQIPDEIFRHAYGKAKLTFLLKSAAIVRGINGSICLRL